LGATISGNGSDGFGSSRSIPRLLDEDRQQGGLGERDELPCGLLYVESGEGFARDNNLDNWMKF